MIFEELLPNNLIRHYTDDDTKCLIQKETGYIFEEAVDILPCGFTYEEIDKEVEIVEEEEEN